MIAEDLLKLRRPGLRVSDFLAERVGIADGENRPPFTGPSSPSPQGIPSASIVTGQPPAPLPRMPGFGVYPRPGSCIRQKSSAMRRRYWRFGFVAITAVPEYLISLSWMGGRAV
ncbi:hypothetical protein [Reyranella sp.]|uniref:hypothetical protein n=1 Tax=Reyranella sp. TaxID=1929291 RepID=UPI003C7C1460